MTTESPKQPARPRRKWLILALGAALAVAIALALIVQRPAGTRGLAPEIPVSEAVSMQENGSFLLDVRQPEEWAESHIEGSTLIPLGELEARLGEVPRDRDVVVFCRSGNRSRRGRDILLEAGFKRVTSMAGGLKAWKAEGQETVSGP